jgi:hypothetical protein
MKRACVDGEEMVEMVEVERDAVSWAVGAGKPVLPGTGGPKHCLAPNGFACLLVMRINVIIHSPREIQSRFMRPDSLGNYTR